LCEEEKLRFENQDVAQALGLTEDQCVLLGKLSNLDRSFPTHNQGPNKWAFLIADKIEDVPRTGPLDVYREQLLLQFFNRDAPVFYQERQNQTHTNNVAFPLGLLGFETPRENIPSEIADSINRFRSDHANPDKVAFVMMRFGITKTHNQIIQSLRTELEKHEIIALRADDKAYHDDVFWNIVTYIYGCSFGIAVFERLEQEKFNPNVAFEVGYMMALRKPVLLLKDKTLKHLHADLIGKLYRVFGPRSVPKSIGPQVRRWLRDKNIIS
jgi:hypothetical protein